MKGKDELEGTRSNFTPWLCDFGELGLSVKNNILVKPCTRNWYFSVICQLEIWNNVGLSDALLIMELDVPDPVHLY